MTESKKKPQKDTKGEANLDLGFGGLFKGLGDLVDLVSKMSETGEEIKRSGEFKVEGLGDKGRGVYGFSVRTGIGGAAKVERFGNIRATEEGPIIAEVREPLVDVFDEAEELLIVAELPGVNEAEIKIDIQEDVLSLEAAGERKYAKEILLPAKTDSASLQKSFKNGILELRLRKI